MSDDVVVRFDQQLIAEIRVGNFPEITTLHLISLRDRFPPISICFYWLPCWRQYQGCARSFPTRTARDFGLDANETSPYPSESIEPQQSLCSSCPRHRRGSPLPDNVAADDSER